MMVINLWNQIRIRNAIEFDGNEKEEPTEAKVPLELPDVERLHVTDDNQQQEPLKQHEQPDQLMQTESF